MMSLLPFWTLNVAVPLMSMQGRKLLDFIKNLNLCSEDEQGFLRVWNDMRVSN